MKVKRPKAKTFVMKIYPVQKRHVEQSARRRGTSEAQYVRDLIMRDLKEAA